MPGRPARLALHIGPAELGLALCRRQADGSTFVDRLLVADSGRDGQGLLGAVDELLRSTGTRLGALECIAFAAGPGGFSRVRVACAVAQGLGMATDCPVVPINSLEALSWAATAGRRTMPGSRIVALVDARMQEVYCAAYLCGPEAKLEPVLPPALIKVAELASHLEQWVHATEPTLLCGDAWNRYDISPEPFGSAIPGDPPADEIAAACLSLSTHAQWVTPADAGPIYLRDKVALNVAEQAALRAQNAKQAMRP